MSFHTDSQMATGSHHRSLVLVLLTYVITTATTGKQDGGEFLNRFAVRLRVWDKQLAETVAKQHGFVVKREVRRSFCLGQTTSRDGY